MSRVRSHKWLKEHEDFIFENNKGISSKDLAVLINNHFGLNLNLSQIKAFRARHKLISGLTGRYEKGTVPFNKGKKWDEYVSKESQQGSLRTAFKKGSTPVNHRPVGSERICSKDGYILIKTEEPNVWELKHRYVWEKEHGPIPKDKRLLLLDGVRTNCDLSNLKLVSFAVSSVMNNMNLHTVGNPELNDVGSNIAELVHQTNRKLKRK